MYIHEKYTSSIYLDFNAKTNQLTISIKGELGHLHYMTYFLLK